MNLVNYTEKEIDLLVRLMRAEALGERDLGGAYGRECYC